MGGALALCLALGACGSDSIIAPPVASPKAGCTSGVCGVPDTSVPFDAASVLPPIEDAAARIVPSLNDVRARVSVSRTLDALCDALRAGDRTAARSQLAQTSHAIDVAVALLGASPIETARLDLAALSAIRQALEPAAEALEASVP